MLVAETVTLSLGAIQWIVALVLLAFGGASGVLVARALHGRALSQLEQWKKALTDAGFTVERWKEFLQWKKALNDAGLTAERWRESIKWQSSAEDELEELNREHYARTRVEQDREKRAGASTTQGTKPYPRGRG